MKDVHTKKSALNWLEGQIISYLYGGIDTNGLSRCVKKVTSEYHVEPQHVRALVDSIEKKQSTYYGGRYRLAYAAIARRPGEARFVENHHRSAAIESVRSAATSVTGAFAR